MTNTAVKSGLIEAVELNDVAAVENLFLGGADINEVDGNGRGLLMVAVDAGHIEMARLLVSKGMDVNAACNNGATPLMSAAYAGHVEIMQLLIDNGVEIDALDVNGRPALIWASYRVNNVDAIRLLVESGADIDARALNGDTALSYAEKSEQSAVVAFLEGIPEMRRQRAAEAAARAEAVEVHVTAAERQALLKGRALRPTIIRGMRP